MTPGNGLTSPTYLMRPGCTGTVILRPTIHAGGDAVFPSSLVLVRSARDNNVVFFWMGLGQIGSGSYLHASCTLAIPEVVCVHGPWPANRHVCTFRRNFLALA